MKIPSCLRRQTLLLACRMNSAAAPPGERSENRSIIDRVRTRLRSGSEGGALVEFALVLPMILTLTTGILIFGIALANYLNLTEGVSAGGRALAISRGQTLDPCNTSVTAIYAAAPNLTQSKYTFSFVLNGTTYTGTSCSSTSTTTGAAGNLVQGGTAKVTATYPCNLTIYGKSYACTLTAQITELVQ